MGAPHENGHLVQSDSVSVCGNRPLSPLHAERCLCRRLSCPVPGPPGRGRGMDFGRARQRQDRRSGSEREIAPEAAIKVAPNWPLADRWWGASEIGRGSVAAGDTSLGVSLVVTGAWTKGKGCRDPEGQEHLAPARSRRFALLERRAAQSLLPGSGSVRLLRDQRE